MSHGHPGRAVIGLGRGGKGMAKHVPARLPAVGTPVTADGVGQGAADDGVQNVVGSVSSLSPGPDELGPVSLSIVELSQGGRYAVSPSQLPITGSVGVGNGQPLTVRQTVVEEEIRRRITTTEYVSDVPPPGSYRAEERPKKQITARPEVVEVQAGVEVEPYRGPFIRKPSPDYVIPQPTSYQAVQLPNDMESGAGSSHLFKVVLPAVVGVVVLIVTVLLARWAMADSPVAIGIVLLVGCVSSAALIAKSYYSTCRR